MYAAFSLDGSRLVHRVARQVFRYGNPDGFAGLSLSAGSRILAVQLLVPRLPAYTLFHGWQSKDCENDGSGEQSCYVLPLRFNTLYADGAAVPPFIMQRR